MRLRQIMIRHAGWEGNVMRRLRPLAVIFCVMVMAGHAFAASKRAFIVGNDSYENVVALQKARNDAQTIAKTVQGLGFKVSLHLDLDRKSLSNALNLFEQSISEGDEVFFFFSGHGFEIRGINYLLPTDVPEAGPGQETVVRDAAFDADDVIERLRGRGARVTIAVIDACRDNPFAADGVRSLPGSRGLAQMAPAEGVFILMSAGNKQMALDRLSDADKDPNSVFTRFFVRELVKPGQTLVQTAKRTQVAVRELAKTVGFDQTPAYYDQVIGDVILVKNGPASADVAEANTAQSGSGTITLPSTLQLSPSVSVGPGVTLGPGVMIGGKQAELLVQEQQNLQGANNPALGAVQLALAAAEKAKQQANAALGNTPGPVALLSPTPELAPGANGQGNSGQPPIANFTRSNQGWMVTFSVAEPAVSIAYRFDGKGEFTDLGQLDFLDQRTGQRMPNPNLAMAANQKTTVIEVVYRLADGQERGPFPIRFEPETALFDMQRKTLDQIWPSWVAFRDYDGVMVYFTTLISYRCAISEVRYGLDDAAPFKRFNMPPCNTKDPYSVPENAKIWEKVPSKTSAINIQLVWRDGTVSDVKRIEK
jgi:hypothetical protein